VTLDAVSARAPRSAAAPAALAGIFLAWPAPGAAADLGSRFAREARPFLETHCLNCHDPDSRKGDLDLSAFGSPAAVQAEFRLWQTVLRQVEEEEMPPRAPLPSPEERAAFVRWIRDTLDAIDWSRHRGVARLTLPRLTKAEYNHTLRDLLGIDLRPGDRLLDDGPGLSGFTNDRDALFISPALAEQAFDAAEAALQAVLDLRHGPRIDRVFEAEAMLMTERGSKPEPLPGGGTGYSLAGAGQRTLYDELTVPADGWYRLTVRVAGLGGDSGVRLRVDNEPRHDFPCRNGVPEDHVTDLLLRAGTHQMAWNIELPARLRQPAAVPASRRPKRGTAPPLPADAADRVTAACATNTPRFPLPENASPEVPALVRRLDATLTGMQRRIEYLRLVTPDGAPNELRTYYNLLPERTQVMAETKAALAAALGVPSAEIDRRLLEANADRFASNERVLADTLSVLGLPFDPGFLLGNAPAPRPVVAGAPGIDRIRIEGPVLPSGSVQERVAAWFPEDPAAGARSALAEFLPRAFRRPLRDGELERHFALFEAARDRGETADQALKLAYAAALTSPKFWFRDELGSGPDAFVLDDHQLASRLSYFLWLSMPDDELRALADAGSLRNPETLRAQTRRLLADSRSRAFTATFLGQWLGFSGLGTEHVPDARTFRDFTPSLAEAMKLEPVLVFEDLLRHGDSLTRLLDGASTFANAELAAWYGLPGPEPDAGFQPLDLPPGPRGGLLGMGAVLTASSTPNRTSPVLRGKWVLETLLGRHLAEPPADAGQLDDQAGRRGKTLREELAAHRRHESCAGCHDKIDPIGFGLEPFDAVGRIRSEEAGRPVDAAGRLPGGIAFTGPAELRALLAARHRDEFLANLTRRLTSFALGRALRPEDEGLVRDLLAALEASDHRADHLVEAIVLSEAFRTQGGPVTASVSTPERTDPP
jgi:mono/diheme cytochrome c family protein